jgi:putative ABC transport system substrate-binding protein
VQLKVAILLVHGAEAAVAARTAGGTTPIVCLPCGDVISTGLVRELARPGGRITGLTAINPAMSGKRLELLKQVVPGLAQVAILWNSRNPVSVPEVREMESAASALGLKVQSLPIADAREIEAAFAAASRERAQALVVMWDAMFLGRRKEIAGLALAQRIPSIAWTAELARDGVLMGYGADYDALYRRGAAYVDKLLKGAKSAEIPIEQPTKFELVVNLRTAQSLGLTIPNLLKTQADEVIQ